MTNNTIIQINNISKQFGLFHALKHVSLNIQKNEFFALLGPSGCGKTTLLRIIAGLETPSNGSISIDNNDITHIPANRRPVNMVFQSYAVFPHMDVKSNVEYGLKVTGMDAKNAQKRAHDAMKITQIEDLKNRMPAQLSGGQKQRVALARAIAKQPKTLLLDEPLSALDAKLRMHMRRELTKLQKELGITFIIVTHDQDEALSMATTIAVMNKGEIQQIAKPETLYQNPANSFVAGFIGKINLINAEVKNTQTLTHPDIGEIIVPKNHQNTTHNINPGQTAKIAVRPENVTISNTKPTQPDTIAVKGNITDISYYGDFCDLSVTINQNNEIIAKIHGQESEHYTHNKQIWCAWKTEHMRIFKD